MIKVYLNSIEIAEFKLSIRPPVDIDEIIEHINEKFGQTNWTSFEYIKEAAE
jgi:trehalose-6-phosphate synthase